MNGEGRIPPLLIAGLVFLVLAIGALAYYAGRFGRSSDRIVDDATVELPPPGPPDPAIAETIPTPAEVPPTVTPSVAVLLEKERRTTRVSRPTAPLVERSSQIEVPIPPEGVPAAVPSPTPRRQIVVEIVATAVPQPTPTPEEMEPEEVQEVDPPPPLATPEPVPAPTPGLRGLRSDADAVGSARPDGVAPFRAGLGRMGRRG